LGAQTIEVASPNFETVSQDVPECFGVLEDV
jgi:hypothetical protein